MILHRKFNSGLKDVTVYCPECDSPNIIHYALIMGVPFTLNNFYCKKCGALFNKEKLEKQIEKARHITRIF